MSAEVPAIRPTLAKMPLVTLYLTDRCNSRCITCDYWRHGREDMDLPAVTRLLPSLANLQTQWVLLSGGEPLLNPEWAQIARLLRRNGHKVWLLTSGLALAKHAHLAAQLFDSITVSMDGTNRETYAAIRGLDAFDKVCAGVRAAAGAGLAPGLRITLQRRNYRELSGFVDLARQVGARQVSFLAVDVANPHAFARREDFRADLALSPEDLPEFERRLRDLERDFAEEYRSGFIAESPGKMQRILQYFVAVCRLGPFPPTHCNAPEFSSVITAQGKVQPCFFISGPPSAVVHSGFRQVLNDEAMVTLRKDIREGRRAECATCVCTMWRDPDSFVTTATQAQ